MPKNVWRRRYLQGLCLRWRGGCGFIPPGVYQEYGNAPVLKSFEIIGNLLRMYGSASPPSGTQVATKNPKIRLKFID